VPECSQLFTDYLPFGCLGQPRKESNDLESKTFGSRCEISFFLLHFYFLLHSRGLAPDDVFVVTTVDQRIDFTVGSVTEQNSAFDIFTEEKL
jgi:hypothetical protein